MVDSINVSFRPYCDEVLKTKNLWVWTQKKAMLPPPAIFGVGAKVHPGKSKSRGDGNGAPDTTKAKQTTTVPTTSTTRFCIVDAFQYVGITGILEEKAVKACRGKDCIFTHVSGAPSKTYVHKAVFAGIQQALGRRGGPVKDAWAQAMRGRGKEVFQGPFECSSVLDAQLVTISDRNFNKTLHAFFSFGIVEPVILHQVQVMASLASRYTQINVLMKVHVGALYQFQQSFPSHSARRRLPEAARVEVLLRRAFLLSLSVHPASFARPFRSFRARPATHTIEYDASLTGMGVLVWQGGLVGTPRVLLGYAMLPSPFMATTDSSYQNTYEYLAILLGLLLSKSLGIRDGVFAVLGDSRSSLAWVLQGRLRSVLCRRASIGFSILAVNMGPVVQYIRSCDPRLPLTTWSQVIDHMVQCHQLLSRI